MDDFFILRGPFAVVVGGINANVSGAQRSQQAIECFGAQRVQPSGAEGSHSL